MLCVTKHLLGAGCFPSLNRDCSHSSPAKPNPDMNIIRAEHLGMCFGVRDAIAMAVEKSEREPVTVLGDLVHNEAVLSDLRSRGIQFVTRAEAVSTESVMITAHGASEKTMGQVRAR